MKCCVFRLEFQWRFFDNTSAWNQVMAWRRTDDKPLSESKLTQFIDARNYAVLERDELISICPLYQCAHTRSYVNDPCVRLLCFAHSCAYPRTVLPFQGGGALVIACALCMRISKYLEGTFVSLGRHSRTSGKCETLHFTLGTFLF